MDLTAGVAVRLTALCLGRDGRLGNYPLWQTAVRGAVLVDIALADRLALTDDSITIDDTPTGFPPADALLLAIAVEHERSLDWWIDHGGVRLRDVAAANVASGRWTGRRRLVGTRYTDLRPEATERDRERDAGQPDSAWSPETAAVVAIARAAGVDGGGPEPPPDRVLELTGPARWTCRTVVEHLTDAHNRNQQAAWGGGSVL